MADGYGLAPPRGRRGFGMILAGEVAAQTENQGGNSGGREQRQEERASGCDIEN